MNRVVREHYPASKLPDDLREGIDPGMMVTVTVQEEAARPSRELLVDLVRRAASEARGVSAEEAVRRVRELRDEWDD